jgi:hypothetical protein
MPIKPYQVSRIERFQNSDDVFNTPDSVSIPNMPTTLSSSSTSPLNNIIYNIPTLAPIIMAPTLSPMDAALKSFVTESGLSNYSLKPSIFSETLPTPPISITSTPTSTSTPMPVSEALALMAEKSQSSLMQTVNPKSQEPTYITSDPLFMKTPTNTPIIESFYGSKLESLKHDYVLLKCVLYALAFYVLAHPKVLKMTNRYLPNFDPLVMNMLLFIIVLIVLHTQF